MDLPSAFLLFIATATKDASFSLSKIPFWRKKSVSVSTETGLDRSRTFFSLYSELTWSK